LTKKQIIAHSFVSKYITLPFYFGKTETKSRQAVSKNITNHNNETVICFCGTYPDKEPQTLYPVLQTVLENPTTVSYDDKSVFEKHGTKLCRLKGRLFDGG